MAAMSGPEPVRPRRRSAVLGWVVWIAVNAAAMGVAWRVAEWLVPLPPRPPAGESVAAWTRAFDQYFRTFFVVYVVADIIVICLVGCAPRKYLEMLVDDWIVRRNTRAARRA